MLPPNDEKPSAGATRRARDEVHVYDAVARVLQDPHAVLDAVWQADDADAAKAALRERFGLDDVQATVVMDLQFGRATRVARETVEHHRQELHERLAQLESSGPFFHGTKADLRPGDLLEPGYSSNYGERRTANHIYLTATLDAAVWGAELAVGEGPGRVYRVEPTGPLEDDPNLTDTRFPGNPTRSFRTREPLRVVDEVPDWEPHPPEVLQRMRDHLEELARLGVEAIDD